MLLFSSSSSPFLRSSRSMRPQSCSVFKVPVFFITIILVTFICSTSTVTGKQHSEKHKYYQTLQRHLKSFTVKDDAEDLLALPSDSGPSVAVVAPPPNFSRNGPITQYAAESATSTKEQSSSSSSSSKKYKKWKSHRYGKSKQDEEDNIAQESNQGGAAVAYAAPPPGFSASSKSLNHRSGDSDTVAQESYQSAAYAPPPPPPVSTSSLSAATAKSYDQYLRNSVRTASTKDNVAQESYQRDTYAPAPKALTKDNYAQESYQRDTYAPAPAAKALTKDNYAQESYQRETYAPEPATSTKDSVAQESYQRDTYAPAPAANSKDNFAQESYQRDAYAPAPASPSSSRDYDSYHRTSVDSSSSKTSDTLAEESYQRKEYAPAPPLPSSLTSDADPLIPPPPPTAEARRNYYDQYLRSRSSSSVTNDNQAQESYAPISYAPPEPSPSPAPAVSGKNVITYNDNQAQESYRTPLSYASPPPPPPPPQSSINYYPGHYPPSPPSSYSSQNSGVASSAPVPAYAPSNSYSSAGQRDTYYQASSSAHSPSSYYPENAVPHYAPYPATTPPPAIRAQYHRHLTYYPTQKPTLLQPANKNVIAAASSNQMQVSGSSLLSQHPHLMSIDKHQEEQKQHQQQTAYSSPAASNTPFSGFPGETFEFSPAPPGPPHSPSPPPPGAADSPPQKAHHDQSSEEDSLQNQQKLMWGALGLDYDLYRTALTSPGRLLGKAAHLLGSLRIPKDHYLNVISFVGIYMFMSILLYKQDDLLHNKCEEDEEPYPKEWHYHVGRRFVPAVHKVDKKMQKKFLKLFKGIHLQAEADGDGSSSEEDSPSMVNYVNEMCPKEAFFYSLAPMHLEARMQVQRILVAQPSPAHVYAAAKALLYKHKVHPKVWYLGLMAAALERPDMTGFKLAHPLDAIPDWFIPADLIQDEMDKYRSISLSRSLQKKRLRRAIADSGNSTTTKVILTTTPSPSSTTTVSSSTTTGVSSNSSSTTTKITRRPILYTRRSTTTYRPPNYSFFSGESGSYENFVLDGTPPHLKGDKYNEILDYIPYDEEAINDSVQKYQQINKDADGKYKPKKKSKPKKPAPSEDNEQQEQDASTSASEEANVSNGIELIDLDASASVETEGDNANSSGASNEGNSAQQNDVPTNNNLATLDDDAALKEPAPPSVRPSHLTSSSHSHNAIKVGDLTVVVGSGPSLLNDPSLQDDELQTYNMLDDGQKGIIRTKNRHTHGHGHGHKKKGHKKGKGKGKDDGKCIIVDGKVGRDNGIENKLWYFREDMMVNQFHWYWHLQHPVNATKHPDRRAELFFFTHRQFLARYNVERLSNGLHRMRVMDNIGPGGILFEPYHSHLADVASGRYWTPRFPKRLLRDIRHEHDPDVGKNIMLKDVGTMYSRLVNSAKTGILLSTRNGLMSIRNSKGIEPLANTLEATELSVNPFIYDAFGLHNSGHLVIGLVEDPFWRYKKVPGVMSEVATAMRDPIFYNYHALVDNIVERHKETLSPYKVSGGEFPLLWKGIKILDIEMISKGNGPLNQLRTFWTKKKFELAPSVDGSTGKHAKICAVHLAHEPFTFKITIEKKPCARTKSGKGTIRIFIAPRFDEHGRRLHLKEQRRLMIQLDAFQAKLRIGRNIITRRSHDSSLTQPWTKHMGEFKEHDKSGAADFCGCGWPQHLYIPKGSHQGMHFDLFVMVTNYDEDHVPNHPKDLEIPETCNSPYLLCGHPRRRYPDARPMGYPFDRPPYKTPIPCLQGHSFAAVVCKSFNLVVFKAIDTLEEFVAKAPNMKTIVFDIKHIDKLVKHYHRRH